MNILQGKVAIVTGGGQGVGLGIAAALSKAGASVLITGRDEAKLERAAEALRKDGARIAICPADSREREDARRAVALAIEQFGRIDILVNNAQASVPGTTIADTTDEIFRMTIESGLHGTLYYMQEALSHLSERGGSVINFGSMRGVEGGVGFGAYAATKEAIRGLSRSAAREWGRLGIRVNVVNPAALSPAAQSFLTEEQVAQFCSKMALGRFGDVETDIGALVVFLASDAAAYVTGQTINADGGQVMP